MPGRRRPSVLLLVAALVAACSAGAGDTTTTPATSPTTPAPTTTTTPGEATTSTTLLACDPRPKGVGDAVLPESGNPGYDVEHYEVSLLVDISGLVAATRFEAEATISATAGADLPDFNLDFDTLAVTAVDVDGRPARTCSAGSELTVVPETPIPAGTGFRVTVTYAGRPLAGSDEGRRVSGWHASQHGIALFAEPLAARSWLPSNNHPSDAATFAVSIEVPDGYAAVGPGELRSVTHTDRGVRYRWVMDDPIPTYLVPVVIDRLERVELDGAIPTTVWANVDPASSLDELAATDEAIALLEDWFGPYPFERSGAVLFRSVSELSAALETTPTITYDAELLEVLGPRLVVHELAHMWAGNSVRIEEWRDMWMKEGLATFAEFLWVEATAGPDRYRYDLERAAARVAFEELPPMGDPGGPEFLYTSRNYLQGGLTFATLRARFGDEALKTLLRTWFSRHAGEAAGDDEFLALVDEVLGEEGVAVVEDFLTAEGVPDSLVLPGDG